VFAVGVGTRTGEVVPVLDEEGRATDIKRDRSGGAVRSRLDEALLRKLAQRTGGAYFDASRPGGELPRLLFTLAGLSHAAKGERLVEQPVARFPLCAFLAAVLIGADLVRPRRRRATGEVPAALHSERAAAATLLALLLVPCAAAPAQAQSAWALGDRALRAGRYAEAESLYARRARGDPRPELIVNHATARALKGEPDEAVQELALATGREGRIGKAARYNLGTVLGQNGEIDRGLEALRQALERSPGDEDARWNYEVLLRRKQEQQAPKKPSPSQSRPEPRPSPSAPQNGAQQPSSAGNGAPHPAPEVGPSPSGPPPSGGAGGMTRAQADQLLGALQEVERMERLRQQRLRTVKPKREKDW
jgi:Ca-activated chloride channel family protein